MFVLIGWGLALGCIFGVFIVHGKHRLFEGAALDRFKKAGKLLG